MAVTSDKWSPEDARNHTNSY